MSTVQNYQSEKAAAQLKTDVEKLEQANRATWDELLAMFPLADNTANYKLFVEYNNPLTVAGGEHLLRAKPQGFEPALTTREALVEELGKLIRENTTEKTLSDFDHQSMVVRFSTYSLRQLRNKKREILFKHAHKTAESAREYLTEVRKTEPSKFPGFPRLPEKMILPHGPLTYTDINAEFLQNLSRADYFEFKRFVRLYGSEQVTARMRNEA